MTQTPNRPIHTVLVANRGEIACRVIETLRRMGIRSVAVYSDADADARHVRAADVAVRIGPAAATQSYLDIDAVLRAARETGADAVHPGYGFLSENQAFAAALAEAGIVFIGPPASAIATMGDKITARAAVSERDVPVVPGLSRPGLTDDELIAAAPDIGFPVLIKPSAGGGGKGMHRVESVDELPEALRRARREAAAAFGDDSLFLEHFVDTPRHIEVQVLADTHGSVIHLGERECSLQRRHQKVIEEAPSALLDDETRARIGGAACDAARSVGYTGAGTVEFIVSAHHPDTFFFMEMNTRLQVEHPVTELVTGVDLVEQQIRVARGEPLSLTQDDIELTGHAIEARVYAEDPANGFLPTGGTIAALTEPDTSPGTGVRVDSAMQEGLSVGSDYDPMLAKVIAHGGDRTEALERLDQALAHTRVLGVVTNIDFCRFVLGRPEVVEARLDTELLDRLVVDYAAPEPIPEALVLAAVARIGPRNPRDVWAGAVGWRIGEPAPVITRLVGDGRHYTVAVTVDEAGEDILRGTATVTRDLDSPADASHRGSSSDEGTSHRGSSSDEGTSHRGSSSDEGAERVRRVSRPGGGDLDTSSAGASDYSIGGNGTSHRGSSSDEGAERVRRVSRPGDGDLDTSSAGASDYSINGKGDPTADITSWTAPIEYRRITRDGTEIRRLIVDGVSQTWSRAKVGETWWVSGPRGTWQLDIARPLLDEAASEAAGDILSPMPGTVVAVPATDGDEVTAGSAIVIVEAMKMEHTLTASTDGTVELSVRVGDKVDAGQVLARIQADTPVTPATEEN